MTTSPEGAGVVPEWTLGDRLRKARELTGLKVPAFAALIEVSAKTVNNAESGKHSVRPITISAWAMASGVSREWLETGEGEPVQSPDPGGPGGDSSDKLAKLTARKAARTRASGVTRRYLAA